MYSSLYLKDIFRLEYILDKNTFNRPKVDKNYTRQLFLHIIYIYLGIQLLRSAYRDGYLEIGIVNLKNYYHFVK